mmetsp:Transcript_5275/g.9913  ORF Transcript_5275/g.9913 Transcript_5275/m.9913 type:complete len:336 (-) Transcript_5275:52-1059(-)
MLMNSTDPKVLRNFKLVGMALAMVPVLHIWRTCVRALFVPLATRGSGLKEGSKKCDKFVEQCWLAVHYIIAVSVEVYALSSSTKQWPPLLTEETKYAQVMAYEDVLEQNERTPLFVAYVLQFSFYFLELLTLILDKRARARSDAFVYAFHHVLTVILIAGSCFGSAFDMGVVILFCHDISDIFLCIAKCFVYTEDHARANYSRRTFKILEALGVFFFVVFLISFGFSRLVLLPMYIYVNAYLNGWCGRDYVEARDGPSPETQPVSEWHYRPDPYKSLSSTMNFGVVFLIPLHVYWFRLALRVAYRAVMGLYDDERSDDEDDAPPDERKIARKKKQ